MEMEGLYPRAVRTFKYLKSLKDKSIKNLSNTNLSRTQRDSFMRLEPDRKSVV